MGRNARFVIVTGISGSGRSTCLHALEDIGFYCVDNLPTALLPTLEAMMAERLTATPVAVGIDIRAGELLGDLDTALKALKIHGVQAELLFLDCADDILIRRFAETRRKHPIWQAGTVTEAIRFERDTMMPVRERATVVVDTSEMNVHQLKRHVQRLFDPEYSADVRVIVSIQSFGFKHGLPRDADYVLDVRYVENPFFVPHLSPMTGLDAPVREFVLERGGMQALKHMTYLLDYVLPLHAQEGRAMVSLALGCTGGQHRSVALAEALADHIRLMRLGRVTVSHRDLKAKAT